MAGPRVGDAYIMVTADGKAVSRALRRIQRQTADLLGDSGKESGARWGEEMTDAAYRRIVSQRSRLADALTSGDFTALIQRNESIEDAYTRINRLVDDMEKGHANLGRNLSKNQREQLKNLSLTEEQARRVRATLQTMFLQTAEQRDQVEMSKALVEAEKDRDVAARRRAKEQEASGRRLLQQNKRLQDRMEQVSRTLTTLDTRTLAWSRRNRRAVTSMQADFDRLKKSMAGLNTFRDVAGGIRDLDAFADRVERVGVKIDRTAKRISGGDTWIRRLRTSVRQADRDSGLLMRTWVRLSGVFKSIKIPNFKEATARMDSTVRAVLILVALAAEHVATLGSALASAGTAIISSLVYALGVIVPLASGAAAALLGVGLAVASWDTMVKTVDGLSAALDRISTAWSGQAKAFGDAWGPALTTFLDSVGRLVEVSNIGASLGPAVAGITSAFTEVVNGPGMQNFIAALQGPLPEGLRLFGEGLAGVTDGVLNLLGAAGPGFERLGGLFAQWGQNFSDSMERMASDGTIEDFVDRAIDAWQDLMGVIGPLGTALGNVFNAGESSGGRLLERLGAIMQRFEEWTGSLQGQNALADWFANGEQVMGGLGDLLAGVGEALAGLVDEGTVSRLGDLLSGLGEFAPTLGGILRTVSNLDLLGNLVTLLNTVGDAMAPLMPVIQELAATLGGTLGQAIQTITPLLMSIGTALTPLLTMASSLITALLPPILAVVDALSGALMPVFDALGAALEPLMPVVTDLASTLGDVLVQAVTALAPLLASLGEAVAPILTVLGELVGAILPLLAPALTAIMSALQPVLDLLVGVLSPLLTWLGEALASVIGWLQPIVTFIVEGVINNIIGVVEGFSGFIQGVVATVKGLLDGDFSAAWEGIKQAVSGAIEFVWNLVQLVFIGKLVKGIGTALKSIGTFFSSTWTTVKTGVANFFSTIVSRFTSGLSSITTSVSSRLTSVRTFFSNAWTNITTGISNFVSGMTTKITTGVGNVVQKARELPGKLLSALGNLLAKGREIAGNFITGMVNGIVNGASRVVTAAKDMAKRAWNAVTDFLGISSPSKVMQRVGHWFNAGFEQGIEDESGGPEGAARSMVKRVLDAVDTDAMVEAGIAAAENFANGLTQVDMPGLSTSGNVQADRYGAGSGWDAEALATRAPRTVVFEAGSIILNTPASDPEVVAEQVLDILNERLANSAY